MTKTNKTKTNKAPKKSYILCAGLAFALAGCMSPVGISDPNFGNSVRETVAAQTVNPDAPTTDTIAYDGARATLAQGRYKTDTVEKPKRVDSQSSGGSGSGGGGGGGSR